MVGLASIPAGHVSRRSIEPMVDTCGAVPLLSCWSEGRGIIPPEILDVAVRRLQHRWPTIVLNLPHTCLPETIAMGISLATHVVLVTDAHHANLSWLYQRGHQLSAAAHEGRVTVLAVGAAVEHGGPETVGMPSSLHPDVGDYGFRLPTDAPALAAYYRLLERIYAPRS